MVLKKIKMINIILALASIMLGLVLIVYYSGLKKEHKGGLTINLLGSGVGFIMIGLVLIARELF